MCLLGIKTLGRLEDQSELLTTEPSLQPFPACFLTTGRKEPAAGRKQMQILAGTQGILKLLGDTTTYTLPLGSREL